MKEWIQPGPTSAAIAASLGAIGIALLLWRRAAIRDTTLIAPWYWCLAYVLMLAGSEVLIGMLSSNSSTWHEPLRYATAAMCFCPTMALLGAKRPQDKAWHLIVVSMWIILVLPAVEQFVFQPDQPLEIHDARTWFLLALVFVSLINMLPTRFWPSSLLQLVAQVMLLAEYLPLPIPPLGTAGVLLGASMALAAIVVAAFGFPKKKIVPQPEDQLWLDFRDSFGTLWALRVAERINAAASNSEWGIELAWNGFHRTGESANDQSLPTESTPALQATMKNLLRRFVSQEWIDQRLSVARSHN